jgi:hypothetical protein
VSGEAVDRFSRCSPRVVERLSTEQLVALKRRWIATPKTPENSRLRHEAIQRVNELLQPAVAPRRAEVGAQLERAERQAAAARVLHWREFCFCLHSRRRLRDFLDQTLPLADAACFNEF